jgi:hypothetical protein
MRKSLVFSLAVAAMASLPVAAEAAGSCGRGKQCFTLVETGPVYGTVQEEVLVAPARRVKRHLPAVIDEVSEAVVVQPERRVARHVPAEYGTVHERVMTDAGGKRWVESVNAHGQVTGCWVHVKPRYATIARTVVVRPASVAYETLPAIVQHRTRRVVIEPSRTVYDHVPAQYQTRSREVLVSRGSARWQAAGGGCNGRGILGSNCR